MLAKDLFDHNVEWLLFAASGVADQAAKALEVLHGIAQAVDVVQSQALQPALGDQLLSRMCMASNVPASSIRKPASELTSKKRR